MTATNHALTGAFLGLAIGSPWLAPALALISHFVCDALPHYGSNLPDRQFLKSRRFRVMLVIDAGLCVLLVLLLAIVHPRHWLLAAICAFIATSPDLGWINSYRLVRQGASWQPNLFSRFAGRIQWFQRPIGAVVEAVWFISALIMLRPYLA